MSANPKVILEVGEVVKGDFQTITPLLNLAADEYYLITTTTKAFLWVPAGP